MCLELSALETTVNSLQFPVVSKIKSLTEMCDKVKLGGDEVKLWDKVKLHERSEIKVKQSEIGRRKKN
jgi:hypothetical protein